VIGFGVVGGRRSAATWALRHARLVVVSALAVAGICGAAAARETPESEFLRIERGGGEARAGAIRSLLERDDLSDRVIASQISDGATSEV
jgi:hypothetical protein